MPLIFIKFLGTVDTSVMWYQQIWGDSLRVF